MPLVHKAHTWLLEITFVQECARVCVCVCVQATKNHSREISQNSYSISPTAFQFLYITLAINITDGRCLSDEVRRQFLPKNSKRNAVYICNLFQSLTS